MRRLRRKWDSACGDLFRSRTARVTTELSAVIILTLIVLAIVFREHITVENITHLTPGNLWLATLVFMLLYAAKSMTAVVYVKLLYAAAGLVFPLPAAIAVNIAGTLIELSLPYILGRIGGRDAADFIVSRRPKLGRISALRNRSNFWFSFFVRAVGLFPCDPVSIYFGACGMPFGAFLAGSTAGILPIMLVSTILGTESSDPASPRFIVSAVLFVLLQAGAGVIFLIWIRKNNAAISAAEKELASDESSQ